MPVRLQAFRSQPGDNSFQQTAVLKTAAAQYNAPFTKSLRHLHDRPGQRMVKFGGNFTGTNAALQIFPDFFQHGKPVEQYGV